MIYIYVTNNTYSIGVIGLDIKSITEADNVKDNFPQKNRKNEKDQIVEAENSFIDNVKDQLPSK